MKKILLLASLIAIPLTSTPYAFAKDGHGHEGEVEHYAHDEIHSKEEAHAKLTEKAGLISSLVENEKIDDAQFEKIHEISYTLEAATDYLIANNLGDKETLENLDEAVQAIHSTSENHIEDAVREWTPKLDAAITTVVSGASAEKATTEEKTIFEITIKDHTFTPAEIHAPAGKKLKLIVHNQDPTPEEFESDDFRREKIIPGGGKATIYVGPLKPGKYHFFGEFNLDKANGYLIVE